MSKLPDAYDPRDYPAVAVTVDVVVLTIVGHELNVLLVRRGGEPFLGDWALPGGFIHENETLDEAADRELREETGVRAAAYLKQIRSYGDPERDPRMRVVTIAYLAIMRDVGKVSAGTDADEAGLFPVSEVIGRRRKLDLAFDHRMILSDAVEHAREQLEYTSIGTAFVGPKFTLSELRGVYEAAWDHAIDPGNFRRKVLSSAGLVEALDEIALPGPEGGKPAQLYRAGRAKRMNPPISRPRPGE